MRIDAPDTEAVTEDAISTSLAALDDTSAAASSPPEPTSPVATATEEPPESVPALPEGTEPAAPAALAPTPPDLTTYSPPEGGEALAFRLDRQPITLDGAKRYPTGVWIPNEVWDRQLVPKYLGDRGAWRQRENQYEAALRQSQEGNDLEVLRSRAAQAKLLELLQDPEKLADFQQNYQTRLPTLLAEAKAKALEDRLALYTQREQQAQQERQQVEEQNLLLHGVGTLVEEMMAEPGFKGITEAQALVFLTHLRDDIGLHKLAMRDGFGRVQPDEDQVRRLFLREAGHIRSQSTQQAGTQQAKAANAAATKPTPPGTGKVLPPRTQTGQFKPQPTPKPGERFDREEFLRKTTFFE